MMEHKIQNIKDVNKLYSTDILGRFESIIANHPKNYSCDVCLPLKATEE